MVEICKINLTAFLSFLLVLCIAADLQYGYSEVPIKQAAPNSNECKIEKFGEQTIVNCSGLGLTSIPQDIPPDATVLDLSHNCIPVLQNDSLTSLPHLKHLNISHSCLHHIQTGAFCNVSLLRVLNLEHNNLTVLQKFSFSALHSLEKLLLSHNNLTVIDPESLHNLTNLKSLELNHNGLNSLNNKSQTEIWEGSDCPFAMIGKLQTLLLHGNSIDGIDVRSFCGLFSLRSLDLSKNNITYIPNNTFTDLTSLEKLNIAHNIINDIEEDAFHSLFHLRELHLQNNSLSFLHTDTFYPCADLKFLNISFNNLTKTVSKPIFHMLPQLNHLDLNHNKLEIACDKLRMFQDLQHLEYLDMSFTGDIWDSGNCSQTLQNLTNLVSLKLSSCEIERIPLKAFQNQKKLQYLDLSYNDVHVHSLPIDIFVFCNSTNLFVNLKANHIESLPAEMVSNLHPALKLDLSDNSFFHINHPTLTVIKAVSIIINLAHNPFECDCQLLNFVNWAETHETQVVGWHNNITEMYNVTDEYKCMYGDKKEKSLEKFHEHCNSIIEYLVPLFVLAAIVIVLAVGYLLYRKKRRQGYEKIGGSNLKFTKHYEYDLYIIHSSEDLNWVQLLLARLEVEGHYKVSYPDKDFVLGRSVFENIDKFLEQSRTILGIISTNSLNSNWCRYELERARMLEIEQRGEHQLILILLEDRASLLTNLTAENYSKDLVNLVQNKTNLEWSDDGRQEPECWKRLKKDIGKPMVEGQV